MAEPTKVVFGAIIGFILGLLSWIIKDIYEKNSLKKRLINEMIIQLKTSLTFIKSEFKGLFDIFYSDETKIITINNYLKFNFYETNYDKLSFLDSETCESIYVMYLILNENREKIVYKLTHDTVKDFSPEIDKIKKAIYYFSDKHNKFKELKEYINDK